MKVNLPYSFSLKAFTIIELLITVAIIGILSAATIPSLSNFGSERATRLSADQFVADLELLRSKSLAGVYAENEKVRWGLQFGNTSYTMGYLKGESPNHSSVGVQTMELQKSLFVPANGGVYFEALTGRYYTGEDSITINSTDGSISYTITINKNGRIVKNKN